MAEYIEREALIQHMQECKDENAFTLMATGYAYSFIEAAPTADVVEVVHGEWIVEEKHKTTLYGSYIYKVKTYHCPYCKKHFKQRMKFCGECGAKMDGVSNG